MCMALALPLLTDHSFQEHFNFLNKIYRYRYLGRVFLLFAFQNERYDIHFTNKPKQTYSKVLSNTSRNQLEYIHCKPIPVMRTGISLCSISIGKTLFSLQGSQLMKTGFSLCGNTQGQLHRENPVLALYWPCKGLQCSARTYPWGLMFLSSCKK